MRIRLLSGDIVDHEYVEHGHPFPASAVAYSLHFYVYDRYDEATDCYLYRRAD